MSSLAPRLNTAIVIAAGTVTTLFACTSTDEVVFVDDDADAAVDAAPVENDAGNADAAPDVDAAVEEDGNFVVPDASVVCSATPCVKKIAGNADGFCALLADGRVSCWGANNNARLGVSAGTQFLATPTIVDGLTDVTHVDIARANTCARVADGSVYCWGLSTLVYAAVVPDGGTRPIGNLPKPTHEDAVPAATSISLGTGFACSAHEDGTVTCWGSNNQRQLGRGKTDFSIADPAGKATLLTQPAATVIAGDGRTFVIALDGGVLSWGKNADFGGVSFLLGRDSSENPSEQPTPVPLLSRVRNIATTTSHSCAVAGRFVMCWGVNASGQLGLGTFDNLSYLPARTILADVTDAEDADGGVSEHDHDVPVQVVTGPAHSCAVLGSGRVYCWGDAGFGRVLGARVEARVLRGMPTRIDGLSGPAVALASGTNAICALLRSGAVECWGVNSAGQLGTGATDDEVHPTPVRVRFSQ